MDKPIDDYHCWVDTTTVLYCIKGPGMRFSKDPKTLRA